MRSCPKCGARYHDDISFCLQDGTNLTLVQGSENPTLEKADPLGTTPAASAPTTNQITGGTIAANDKSSGRGMLWFLVGVLCLACLLLLGAVVAGGIWYAYNATDTNPTADPKPTSSSIPKPKPSDAGLTKANFKKIKTGMSYKEVVEILGEEGDELTKSVAAGQSIATYMWSAGTFSNVTLTFRNDKLISKFQMGLK